MNKRTKKKITKRLNCKTYLGFRKKLINNFIFKRIDELGYETGQVIAHLVLSRKANYKTIHSLKLFTNCYPVSMGSSFDYNSNDKELSIDFSCNPINNDTVNNVADYLLKQNLSKQEVDGIIANFMGEKYEN